MTRWFLVRHGRTNWNKDKRIQGQADIPLDNIGVEQAKRLGERLNAEEFAAIYSSDLKRAIQTAEPIADGQPIREDKRLRELGLGRFEGLVYADIEKIYPEELKAWEENRDNAPPQGEKFSELVARTQAFFEEARRAHAADSILIASHGGTLRVLMCLLTDLPPEKHWLFRFDNASLTEVLTYEGGTSILYLNDVCHITGLES